MRICNCCDNYDNIIKIFDIEFSFLDDFVLNNRSTIYKCTSCNYYYSDSNNNQMDYDNYYTNFNNNFGSYHFNDMNNKTFLYLEKSLNFDIKSIIDYGSGKGLLTKLLSEKFNVDNYEIGDPILKKKYDCLILSHVLEHIYDLNNFINNIKNNINEDKYIYIEVPNTEYYEKFKSHEPLHEINHEHINFFSKKALIKLMLKHNFIPVSVIDDYFIVNDSKYWVIRSIFKLSSDNKSFDNYIKNDLTKIESINIPTLKNLYIYGCGFLTYKMFNKISSNCDIINIVDDNPLFKNKKINNIEIINYEMLQEKINDNDNIIITAVIHENKIKEKLKNINKKINIIPLFN
jgi:hypothetical protein